MKEVVFKKDFFLVDLRDARTITIKTNHINFCYLTGFFSAIEIHRLPLQNRMNKANKSMMVVSLDNERSNDDVSTSSTSQSSIFQKVELQHRDYSKLALLPLF